MLSRTNVPVTVVLVGPRRDLGLRHLDRQVPDLPFLVPEVVPLELGLHCRSSASIGLVALDSIGRLWPCKPR